MSMKDLEEMQNDMELIKIQLEELKKAQESLIKAMEIVGEFDELEEEYKSLDLVLYRIEDLISGYRIQFDNLEEEAMYKENEQQWKKEQRDEENEYWRSKI